MPIDYGTNNVNTSGIITAISGNFSVLRVNGTDVSISGHSHAPSDITNFNSSVSGLVSGIYAPLSGKLNQFANTSSSELLGVITDETGSGLLVFNNSPTLTGVPLAPTASSGTNTNQIASTAFVRTEISNLVASAPATLDTLNELADALGDDANFSATITNNLAGKANLNGAIFTGAISGPSGNFTVLQQNGVGVSTVGHVHTSSDITDFNTAVSGLLPVKDIVGGTGISINSVSGIYTITSTGSGVLSDQAKSLVTTVFNNTGSPIPKMSAVYINGGQGDLPTVSLAIATSDMTSAGTYGLAYETINNMSSGKVIVFGALTGLNTDQFNPTAPHGNINGTILYLSPTTSGALTTSKPSAPNHIVAIGTVVRTHQNEGIIEVRVQNGFELEELHNVAISGVTNGQFLQYNSASGLWLASSSGNFTTLRVNGTGVSISGHAHTPSDIINFNSSVSGLLPVTDISGGQNITVSKSGTIYTVAVTGSLGLTTEEVDDRISNLLVAGSGIGLNYNDGSNTLTVSVSGLSSNGTIGNGASGVIFYELNQPLNIVGSGTTNVAYDNSTKTVTIGLTSTIKEYELINSTKSIFTVTGGYALNNIDVYHNGVRLLASGDYTATNGSTFTLSQPAISGDVVEWLGCSIVPQHQLILGEVRSDTINNINYLGRAVAGSSEASGVWTIKRYTIDSNGLDITTATASNASWTNRLSASYV